MLVGQSQEGGNSSFAPDLEKIRSAGKRMLTILDQKSTSSGRPGGRVAGVSEDVSCQASTTHMNDLSTIPCTTTHDPQWSA